MHCLVEDCITSWDLPPKGYPCKIKLEIILTLKGHQGEFPPLELYPEGRKMFPLNAYLYLCIPPTVLQFTFMPTRIYEKFPILEFDSK